MGLLSGVVVKGPHFHDLDRWLEKPTQAILDELKKDDLYTICKRNGFMISSGAEHHVTKEGFGDAGEPAAWWSDLIEKERVLRSALIKAVELCLVPGSAEKKVVTYWIRGMDNLMEATVLDRESEVIVLWLTPGTPSAKAPSSAAAKMYSEDIWTIGPKAQIEEYVANYPDAGYPIPVENGAAKDANGETGDSVKVLRVIGY